MILQDITWDRNIIDSKSAQEKRIRDNRASSKEGNEDNHSFKF